MAERKYYIKFKDRWYLQFYGWPMGGQKIKPDSIMFSLTPLEPDALHKNNHGNKPMPVSTARNMQRACKEYLGIDVDIVVHGESYLDEDKELT